MVGESTDWRHLVSSMKRNTLECLKEVGRSLMHNVMRKRSGPSRLPWGTPETIGRIEELQ